MAYNLTVFGQITYILEKNKNTYFVSKYNFKRFLFKKMHSLD